MLRRMKLFRKLFACFFKEVTVQIFIIYFTGKNQSCKVMKQLCEPENVKYTCSPKKSKTVTAPTRYKHSCILPRNNKFTFLKKKGTL